MRQQVIYSCLNGGNLFFFFWQIPEITFWHNTRLLLHAIIGGMRGVAPL